MDILQHYINRFKYLYMEVFDKGVVIELDLSEDVLNHLKHWSKIDRDIFITNTIKEYLNRNEI